MYTWIRTVCINTIYIFWSETNTLRQVLFIKNHNYPIWSHNNFRISHKITVRGNKYLSRKSLVVNQVFRSLTIFASKMKMELLKSVLITIQGTATEFSAPLWAVDVKNRRTAGIKQLSSHSATWVVKTDLKIGIAFLLHFLCYDVDRRLEFSSAQWKYLGPVAWSRDCWEKNRESSITSLDILVEGIELACHWNYQLLSSVT